MDGPARQSDCPRCQVLEARVAALEEELRRVKALLEETRRAGKRQAAPFRKKQRKANPKPPGRKPGEEYGQHARRLPPSPEEVTERIDVPLPQRCSCGSCQVQEIGVEPQWQTDLEIRRVVRQFDIHVGQCQTCGAPVQGRHELQTSQAVGAAAHQLGPTVHALIALLNKRLAVPYGKIVELLAGWGLHLARATAARSVHRTAKRCQPALEQVRQDIRGSPMLVPDETGWRVGGLSAWLHVVASTTAVLYLIDDRRDAGPLKGVIGLDWRGFLVHDGWAPYDHFTSAIHQTCLAHLLRRCDELLETATGAALRFPGQVRDLLTQGLKLRDRHEQGEVSEHGLKVMAGRLLARLEQLTFPNKTNPDNERLAAHLYAHRHEVFAFLQHPGLDATNWRGEHAVRWGVAYRKVWGGNRTRKGAQDQATLMSVLGTAMKRLVQPFQFLHRLITSPTPVLLPPPPAPQNSLPLLPPLPAGR